MSRLSGAGVQRQTFFCLFVHYPNECAHLKKLLFQYLLLNNQLELYTFLCIYTNARGSLL